MFGSIFVWFFALYLTRSEGDMAEVNQSTVKTVNIHQSKIDVVKFDGMNNWKGKRDVGKSKTDNHQLGKNQCAYCIEKGHWKIICPKLKKYKELKPEANLIQVVSTLDGGTSQAGGLVSDSSSYSLSVTLIICCSGKSE